MNLHWPTGHDNRKATLAARLQPGHWHLEACRCPLQVQRVAALCRRIAALIAHEHGCADAMIAVCKRLSAQRLNRLQSIFDSLDMELVSDFVRIRIFDTSCPFAQPPEHRAGRLQSRRTPAAAARGPSSIQERARSPPVDMQQALERTGSRRVRTQTRSPERERGGSGQGSVPGTGGGGAPMRFEALRAAGHPFVCIADKMLTVRAELALLLVVD